MPSSLVPRLRAHGAVEASQPERTYTVAQTTVTPDPLEVDEWWRQQIGLNGLTPPGPGVPITIVDSGVDFAHPEFVGRPDLVALNSQEPVGVGGEHGTSVASVIGAPANGVGLVGIYPQAVLRSWDAALGSGTRLDSGQIAAGILAAARAGRGVINLSVGGSRDLAVELAVKQAVALGSLVVAASGNSGEEGSPIGYPAALAHVTTVAATDSSGTVASFSSRSNYVDLAAPGVGILVASAIGGNWQPEDGTSFSSPIVAGAAAWIWTARPELTASQVAEVLRRSARDIGPPAATPRRASACSTWRGAGPSGAGQRRLRAERRRRRGRPGARHVPQQAAAVDDVGEAARQGRAGGSTSGRTRATCSASGFPPSAASWRRSRRPTTATSRCSRARAHGRRQVRDERPSRPSKRRGTTERLVYDNVGKGRWAYVAVTLPSTTVSANYQLSLGSAALKRPAKRS